MAVINELKWQTMTAAVNEIKSPNRFLNRLLFGAKRPVSTEDIEIDVLTKAREIAPFIRKNGEGIMVEGHGQIFQNVQAPNIRIKRPFTPSELLFGRTPGTIIFIEPGQQINAVQAHINRDLQVMADLITNAQEFLASQAIQGVISFSVADQEVFTITFPKPAGNNITLTTFWDNADPTLPEPEINFLTAKRVISDEVGLAPTDCILGLEASESFLRLAKKQELLDRRNISAGMVEFTSGFDQDGVIFLGNFSGIRVWEYSRTASLSGVATSMIRPKFAEFVTASPAAELVEYFGAIPDIDAFQGRLFQAQRFSKSWTVPDPSAQMSLLHSRPLPVPRRPGANVSMKVVSG